MKKLLLGFILLHVSICIQAQSFLENNPPSIKWYQINTEHFRVLFPKGFESQAQRMANTLQYIHHAEAKSLGSEPRKISIILQNQSSIANGFVSMLPRRSEFYTMPSQNYNFQGTNDWLDMLASHEYRHIVQYQHATRGFNKALYYLFGSTIFTGMSQANTPKWFWEGDAVATETAFTPSGRGRIPNFSLAFRANLMEGREFNYQKQYLRSYKHFIPDHYVLGYHMVSYLRKRTSDPEIWGKITGRSWNVPFIPFRFSSSIKKESGLYVNDLYREMVKDLKQQWSAEQGQQQFTPFEKVSVRRSKAYTDYLYPQVMEDGSIVALKKGIGDIERFVKIGENEKKIFTPGIYNETGMNASSGSILLWNEYGFSARWGVRNFSLIKTYDTGKKQKRVIGDRHERYAGSALSPDSRKVVTVRSANSYQTTLVILDFSSGEKLREFPNPDNSFFSMPRWSEDSKKVVVLKTTKERRSIVLVDALSGEMNELVPPSDENIGYPVLYGNYLLFNSPVGGIDNICAIDLQSKQRYQVTSSKYGSYNPAISKDGRTMYYNEQGRDGMDVVKTHFDPSQWKPYTIVRQDDDLVKTLVKQEGRPGLFDSIPQQQLPIKKYSRLKGIINPYSWGIYTDNTFAQAEFGIASRDLLSTTNINLGLTYDINEKTLSRKASISYQGWFPVLDLQYIAGDRKDSDDAFGSSYKFDWEESTVEGGMQIPLTLTNSKYLSQFVIGNYIGATNVHSFTTTISSDTATYTVPFRYVPYNDSIMYVYKSLQGNGDLAYNKFTFSMYHLLRRSYRDFLYRWGYTFDIEAYSTLHGSDFIGSLFALRSTQYFPGLFKHHFLYTRFGYQKIEQGIEANRYTFRNRIPKPRGHSFPSDEYFTSFSANYAMPLWYPDINLGPLLNVQRVRINLFYDFGKGNGRQYNFYQPDKNLVYYSQNSTFYNSFGVETTFDFNVMRFLPQFNVGFRTTYALASPYTNSGLVFEFLIGNIGF